MHTDDLRPARQALEDVKQDIFVVVPVDRSRHGRRMSWLLQEMRRQTPTAHLRSTCVFLLTRYDSIYLPVLQNELAKNELAGIDSYIALSRRLDSEGAQVFGILDDHTVLLLDAPAGIAHDREFRITSRQEDLMLARERRQAILSDSRRGAEVIEKLSLEKEAASDFQSVTLRAADIMADRAATWCHRTMEEDCRWFHESWPYLKILNAVPSPELHVEYYRSGTRAALDGCSSGSTLICGTADHGMLATLIDCLSGKGIDTCSVQILDLCRTPLDMCEWLIRDRKRHKLPTPTVQCSQGNALELAAIESRYDLIVSDAFLTRFDNEDKARVVSTWRNVLKPNGYVITTARLTTSAWASGASDWVSATPGEVEAFAEQIVHRVLQAKAWFPISLHTLQRLATKFASRHASVPFASERDLCLLFEACGFDVVNAETAILPTGVNGRTTYGLITARSRS